MSYTEEEKQRILAEAHGHLERLRHFEPSERSNIIPLRRQRSEPESPPPRMFNDSRIQSLIDAAIETTHAELDEYRKYVSDLLVELLAQFRDELLERYVAEDISKLTGQMKPLVDQIGTLAMKQNEDSSAVNELRAELASVRDELSALRQQLEADVVYLRDSKVRPFSLRGAS